MDFCSGDKFPQGSWHDPACVAGQIDAVQNGFEHWVLSAISIRKGRAFTSPFQSSFQAAILGRNGVD